MALHNKVIWITGASSGIGEALARAFSHQGARLVLSARRRDELERVRASLRDPDRHTVLPLDLTDSDSFAAATQSVLEQCQRIDILVNNGGISQRSRVIDTDLAVDRRVMEVNYFGAIGLTKAVLPAMREAGGGQVVVISSLVGELPTPMRSAYCASKHALHGWFEALRAEEHDRGIRVLMVMPGFIRTNVSINAITADGSAHGVMDDHQAAGLDVDVCAGRIVRAVQRGREQVIIGGREVAGIWLKRFFPSLYRKVIRRIKVT
ncbi:SDR family oxidoreductase [Isoalcanivorax indicus]|uniref:SDR family oxidoreductase n=1 Tax=Isoalcanivorax indicus TaxID=2202653 RepID=UPI000DBA6337|nr:SDR family oxidoreductase [Isoalcanivorax indicus]